MTPRKVLSKNDVDVDVALAQLESQVAAIPGQILSLKDLVNTRIDGLEKATTLARGNLEVRLENMNEWRSQSKDREATFAQCKDLERLEQEIGALKEYKAGAEGKASQASVYISYALIAAGWLITLALRFIK